MSVDKKSLPMKIHWKTILLMSTIRSVTFILNFYRIISRVLTDAFHHVGLFSMNLAAEKKVESCVNTCDQTCMKA